MAEQGQTELDAPSPPAVRVTVAEQASDHLWPFRLIWESRGLDCTYSLRWEHAIPAWDWPQGRLCLENLSRLWKSRKQYDNPHSRGAWDHLF